jgi:hypothetical protein
MNLKYNLINPIIGVIFSLYFLLDTEIKYTNQNEDEIIKEFLILIPFGNKTKINMFDINILYNEKYNYNYIINNINIKKDEMEFLNNLNDNCKFYIQGGAVRDALINHTIRDVDVKSNCPINIIIKDLPKNCKYKIINNVIRIFKPVSIDISQIDDISCHDFTINSIYYDYKKKILFENNNSLIHLFEKKLVFGCLISENEIFDPRYNMPFRFIKFKLRNFSYTKEMEEIIFNKFYYLYVNNKNVYISKINYYKNEWFDDIKTRDQFLNEFKILEDKVNNILVN